jgi:hypothetical protein
MGNGEIKLSKGRFTIQVYTGYMKFAADCNDISYKEAFLMEDCTYLLSL